MRTTRNMAVLGVALVLLLAFSATAWAAPPAPGTTITTVVYGQQTSPDVGIRVHHDQGD